MALRSLANEFITKFRDKIYKMTVKRNIQLAARTTFLEFANELFSDGITWYKIVKLFAFTTEMAFICYRINKTEMNDNIAESLSSYIEIKLLTWIRNSDDWNGLVAYFENRHNNV
ncbi:bcl-2-like protein 1 [Centruroides sculpturatus]|uniref:bcl-2-like protein 1 n=1 Tax=Centruroides sculpturatus TaxID=218467 RepID=UPI000C6CB2AE|nr:bcl-2-like protein 1 [Centruroides sculpturatus]